MKGQYQVELAGKVITVTFEGMFDEKTSIKVCRHVEDLIASFNGEPFYMLINLSNYQGSTPDAHKVGNDHAVWLEGQNCLGKAIVTNEQFMLNIVRNQQTQLSQSQLVTKVFPSEEEAKVWLGSL